MTAEEALLRLKEGNSAYINAKTPSGDISPEIRARALKEGQHPFATVVTCSDSRVVPEDIFSCGIGDIFTVRVAGNVIDKNQLGSIEYAASHLGVSLTVVLGHTHCGAVEAALKGEGEGFVKSITDEIKSAIGGETDAEKCAVLNVLHSAAVIKQNLGIDALGALYRLEDGSVLFL